MAYPFVQVNLTVFTNPNLSGTAIRVLALMMAHAGESGIFKLSRERLAKELPGREPGKPVSLRAITDAWAELTQEGYIERVSQGQRFGNGESFTAHFRITPKGQPPPRNPGSRVPPRTRVADASSLEVEFQGGGTGVPGP